MSNIENIAVILIDPYNDFPHHDGKMYELVRDSIKATDTVVHLKELVTIARAAKIPIFYGLHQQHHAGHYDGWKHMGLTHPSLKAGKVFEEGSWCRVLRGLEPQLSNGDVVVSKHWNSRYANFPPLIGQSANVFVLSSFANTDLDYQLKQRDITNVVIAGLISETCFESTARYAYEL